MRWPALLLLVGTFAYAQDMGQQRIARTPYVWRSVTIKANGFINGIVFSPVERGLFYIHTDMGGAYRHDASTGRWVCLTDWIEHDDDSLNQMGVETMAVDPVDADRVYAGVGTYMGPSAVLRSSDRGVTWQRTNVPFAMNGNGSARNAGERMNVDPNLPSRLIYGTRAMGLWMSEDHGATWSRVESFPTTGETSGPFKDTGVVWTLFDKSSGSTGRATPTIYAGVCTTAEHKVFRSLDAGKTWSTIPNQPGGNLLPTRVAMTRDGKTMYLTYIVGDRYPGPHGAVGGGVFRVDEPASDSPRWSEVSPASGRFGWSGVAIDPRSSQTVYVTTLDRYGDVPDDIFRTTDGGKSWSPLHVTKHRDDSAAAYIADHSIHWVGDVQIDPLDAKHAMFTTGYGIYRTTNLADAHPTWTFYNEGFEQSAVLELVSPPTGSAHLLSAIGDRDGYRHENFDESPKHGRFGQVNDVGQTEKRVIGTCRGLAVAWDDPRIVVRNGGPAAQYSNDGGLTWSAFALAPQVPSSQPSEGTRPRRRSGPSDGNIALSRDGKRAVWAPRRWTVMHANRNDDGSWSALVPADGAPVGDSFVVADLVDPNTFYLRASSGLFVSTDGGAKWTLRTDALPDRADWMRATPSREGHLWLTAGEDGKLGLHRSTDGGKTWTRVNAEQVIVAKQVGLGAAAPGKDYPALFIGGTVGDRRGFFRSDDEGATWVQINDDAHHYGNVTVITGDPRVHGRLYVGTNGRGILYAEPAAPR